MEELSLLLTASPSLPAMRVAAFEVDAPSKPLNDAAPAGSLIATPWESLNERYPIKLHWDPDPEKLCKLINVCCFKALNLGVTVTLKLIISKIMYLHVLFLALDFKSLKMIT